MGIAPPVPFRITLTSFWKRGGRCAPWQACQCLVGPVSSQDDSMQKLAVGKSPAMTYSFDINDVKVCIYTYFTAIIMFCDSRYLWSVFVLHCHGPKYTFLPQSKHRTGQYYSTLLLVEWSHSGYVTSCFIYSMVAVLWDRGLSWHLLSASGTEMCLLWSDSLRCGSALGCDVSTWYPATHDHHSQPVFLTSVRGSK